MIKDATLLTAELTITLEMLSKNKRIVILGSDEEHIWLLHGKRRYEIMIPSEVTEFEWQVKAAKRRRFGRWSKSVEFDFKATEYIELLGYLMHFKLIKIKRRKYDKIV